MIFLVLLSMLMSACNNDSPAPQPSGDLNTELGIESVPASLGSQYTSNFNRYTKVVAPNGKAIHIVAQSNITNEQIVRCRSILEHFLRDLPNSQYGSNKGLIANQMANNGATLTLLNGRDDGRNSVEVDGQALFEEEIQVEGHSWYVNQDYRSHRDAAFEEILHLVHDTGIGVDGLNSSPGAAPAFQAEIRAAQTNALNNSLWGIGASRWIDELTRENSLSQEYLAAVIDVYYGLWGADTENATHGMGGLYVAKTRDGIAIEDPRGADLMNNKFFHSHLTYNARIDSDFEGVFLLRFDASVPYTHHSRYLKDITLLGNKNTQVMVNELDNGITGNDGVNTVHFSGSRNQYQVEQVNGGYKVTDAISNRDGVNTLKQVEKLKFSDQTIDL